MSDLSNPLNETKTPVQKSKAKNYALALTLASGGFYFGYYVGILNPMGELMLKKIYNQTDQQEIDSTSGLLNNLFSLGALAGVLLAGLLADKIGRRPVMYMTDAIALLCSVLFYLQTLPLLMVGRFVSGAVAGLYTSVGAIILSELMPNAVCGFANAFAYSILTLAILLAYAVPFAFEESTMVEHCRLIMAFPVIVPIYKVIMTPMLLASDTPKYLYSSSPDKSAAKDRILEAYANIYTAESLDQVVSESISALEQQDARGKPDFMTLVSPAYRARLISGCFVSFAQQVSGINFLIFYSTKLFEAEGIQTARIMTVVIGASNFFGSFIALFAISRFGRKFNIVWGSLFQGLGFLLLLIGFQGKLFIVEAIAVVVYMMFFAVGLGGSQMAYISEILPPLGVSISGAIQWILTAAIAQSLLTLMTAFGPTTMILFFTSACFLFFFTLDYLMIETKDKTSEEIARDFQNKSYKFLDFK